MPTQKSLRVAGALSALVLFAAQAPITAPATEDVLITAPNQWRVLGVEKVQGLRDQGSVLDDTGPKDAELIAFLARDGDVHCDRISVSFADGHSTWLALGDAPVFKEGSLYAFDLRKELGSVRDSDENELTRVNFTCDTAANTPVMLEVLGSG